MSEWRPTCMSEREFRVWDDFAEYLRRDQGIYKPRICADCTPEYHASAVEAGTCNGHPRTGGRPRIVIDASLSPGERFVLAHQRRLSREKSERRKAGIRVRRSSAEVAALRAEVIALRALGLGFDAIGERMSINRGYAANLAAFRTHSRRRAA